MATRLNFTTRDWMWFCAVLALAFGWGGHFRYSMWREDNLLAVPPELAAEMTGPLNRTQDALNAEREKSNELSYVILKLVAKEHRDKIEKT